MRNTRILLTRIRFKMEGLKFTVNEHSHYSGPFAGKAKFASPEAEYEWALTQFKDCNKCNESLPFTNYGFNTSGKDPFDKNGFRLRRGECETCNKKIAVGKNEAKKLAKEIGIPYKAPDGTTCEICGKTEKIVFDHHHDKNIFRGWLCNGCNRSIGMLGENIDNIAKVLNYLNKTEKKTFVLDSESKNLSIV